MRLRATFTMLLLASFLAGCQSMSSRATQEDIPAAAADEQLDQELARLVAEHGVQTAGVGVIRNGELVWTGYYGEQSTGVPASRETLFNVASISKVITTEAVLRLVDEGRLSLDEPMAEHWVDPDLADDPRHELLTPRMVLTHTTGFPNWRFLLDDRKLKFLHDPGSSYGYSGEGFEYLARYVEQKLGRDFGAVVNDVVIAPIGMSHAAYSIDESTFGDLVQPLNERGEFVGHYCRPNGWCRKPGTYSAADDMVVSVESYAKFMLAVMNADGYSEQLAAERNHVHTEKGSQANVDCSQVPVDQCPQVQGFGLGWEVLDYGDSKLLSHGGSDWAELALAYFHTGSRDGLVIFFNAPTERAMAAMPAAIRALDPDSPMENLYLRRYGKMKAALQERQ